MILGFLYGIKALAKGMAQAGDEWRFKIDEKPDGYSISYANTSTNNWLALRDQVNQILIKFGWDTNQVQQKSESANTKE